MPDIQLYRGYCHECSSNVMAVREIPSHAVWGLISVATMGIGVIPWIIVSVRQDKEPWRCSRCGEKERLTT